MAAVKRVIDWRFCAMVVVVMLVATACWGFVARQAQVDSLISISKTYGEQVKRLNTQMDERDRIDALRNQQAAARSKAAAHERAQQLKAIRLLVKILRENGIDVPAEAFAPTRTKPGSSTTRPKGPRRNNPASPTPTAPNPSPRPTPTPAQCQVLPQLCGLPLGLPTLLP
jgi:hypothetical protein